MNVRELIRMLEDLDPGTEVVMSKDSEGNCFSPFADFSMGMYEPETTWSGEFRSDENVDDDGPASPKAIKAICLWPTN